MAIKFWIPQIQYLNLSWLIIDYRMLLSYLHTLLPLPWTFVSALWMADPLSPSGPLPHRDCYWSLPLSKHLKWPAFHIFFYLVVLVLLVSLFTIISLLPSRERVLLSTINVLSELNNKIYMTFPPSSKKLILTVLHFKMWNTYIRK